MSYEAWGEPDYGPELPDGWMSEEDVDELRDILKLVELKPTPGNRAMAALVLIDIRLNPPATDAPKDPNVIWAEALLRSVK